MEKLKWLPSELNAYLIQEPNGKIVMAWFDGKHFITMWGKEKLDAIAWTEIPPPGTWTPVPEIN